MEQNSTDFGVYHSYLQTIQLWLWEEYNTKVYLNDESMKIYVVQKITVSLCILRNVSFQWGVLKKWDCVLFHHFSQYLDDTFWFVSTYLFIFSTKFQNGFDFDVSQSLYCKQWMFWWICFIDCKSNNQSKELYWIFLDILPSEWSLHNNYLNWVYPMQWQ